MSTKDISEEVREAKETSEGEYDPWQDYINWKVLRAEGFTRVRIDGEDWSFGKWGPLLRLL